VQKGKGIIKFFTKSEDKAFWGMACTISLFMGARVLAFPYDLGILSSIVICLCAAMPWVIYLGKQSKWQAFGLVLYALICSPFVQVSTEYYLSGGFKELLIF